MRSGRLESQIHWITREILIGQAAVFIISFFAAALTAFFYFYNGKTFGTLSDYILAVLWGLGLDTTVRGFANVLHGVRGPNTTPACADPDFPFVCSFPLPQ